MKLFTTLIFVSAFCLSGFSQELQFKITGIKDTTVHLVKYVGNKMYYADTAKLVNSQVTFDGSKQEPGILGVFLPGQRYFEFVYNNEKVKMETKSPNYVEHMVVKKSKENQIFLDYMRYMKSSREKAQALQQKLNNLPADSPEKAAMTKELNGIGDEVLAYQHKVVEDNQGTLVAKIIKMSTDIQIPEAPKDEEGNPIDPNFAFNYFRKHFFDNIDLTDDRLVNTPVIQNKLEYFYSNKVLSQHPDTIIRYVFPVIESIPEASMMYRFFVSNVTTHFEKSKYMGMEKVKVHMIKNFYCAEDDEGNPKGYWMDQKKLKDLCENNNVRINLVQGAVPPNLILPDTTNQKWHNLHELEAEYTILYFWDPNCGHCKKVTPKLQTLYDKKFKKRNVEIYSVGKATGEDYEDWIKFIRKNKLSFINVGVTRPIYEQAEENPYSLIPSKTTLESINYQRTYDIYSTPQVWILDKDKKVIGKSLAIPQIEAFIDELQGFGDEEKIFKMDKNTEEIH